VIVLALFCLLLIPAPFVVLFLWFFVPSPPPAPPKALSVGAWLMFSCGAVFGWALTFMAHLAGWL
jgi:hypothetical protein